MDTVYIIGCFLIVIFIVAVIGRLILDKLRERKGSGAVTENPNKRNLPM